MRRFIGGKARNMHSSVRARRITGRGPTDKTVVLGMLERGGVVTTRVVRDRKKRTLQREVRSTRGGRYRPVQRRSCQLRGTPARLRPPDCQSRDHLRRGPGAHEWAGEFLEPAEAGTERHLTSAWSRSTCTTTWTSRHTGTTSARGKDWDRFYRAVSRIFGKRLTYDQLHGRTGRGPSANRASAPA